MRCCLSRRLCERLNSRTFEQRSGGAWRQLFCLHTLAEVGPRGRSASIRRSSRSSPCNGARVSSTCIAQVSICREQPPRHFGVPTRVQNPVTTTFQMTAMVVNPQDAPTLCPTWRRAVLFYTGQPSPDTPRQLKSQPIQVFVRGRRYDRVMSQSPSSSPLTSSAPIAGTLRRIARRATPVRRL